MIIPTMNFQQRQGNISHWQKIQSAFSGCSSLLIITNQNYSEVTTSHWSEWPSLKSQQITNAGEGMGEKGTFLHCWWECKLLQPLWKTVWRLLKELKIELPYDPAVPLLGMYPDKTVIQKDTCTPVFIAALFTIAKTWKQPKCPLTHEWIKMWYIYTMEYY